MPIATSAAKNVVSKAKGEIAKARIAVRITQFLALESMQQLATSASNR
jgi:hypothetical protein